MSELEIIIYSYILYIVYTTMNNNYSELLNEISDDVPQTFTIAVPSFGETAVVSSVDETETETKEENHPRQVLPLPNLGNSCFLNSCLQQLLNIDELNAYHLSHHCRKQQRSKPGFCIECAVSSLLQTNTKNNALSRIFRNLSSIMPSLLKGMQNDAYECWVGLVTAIHDNSITNIVRETFFGKIHSKVQCKDCRCKVGRIEEISELQLEITDVSDLLSALTLFTVPERLVGANKYSCMNCEKKTYAIKKLTIFKAPKYLTIVLKRFKHVSIGGKYIEQKDKRIIEYPLVLDVTPFMNKRRQYKCKILYELHGVLVHMGSTTNNGHYISIIKNDNVWFHCSDTIIIPISENKVLEQTAYMLFYKKIIE